MKQKIQKTESTNVKSVYRKFMLSTALIFVAITINAQVIEVDSLFWVIANDSAAMKSKEEGKFTNSPQLDTLFVQHNVVKYEEAFPSARTPLLQKVYEIECDCNIDTLISKIQSLFPDMYSGFKRLDYENIELYDPSDAMWQTTMQTGGPLWHLKKIQADLAWDITHGNGSMPMAVIDVYCDPSHPDISGKLSLNYDPYDSEVFNCTTAYLPTSEGGTYGTPWHGTQVAGFMIGQTTPSGVQSTSEYASVGFNTKAMFYKAHAGNYLQRAYHASLMNARVLTSSAGGWNLCPANDGGIEAATVKEILDRGTTIIMPAGNGPGNECHCNSIDPVNAIPFFPLSPYYDERVIIVSATGFDDKHVNTAGGGGSFSHYPAVDLCAPGYGLMYIDPTKCGGNTWPYGNPEYGNGTSFAAPIVAGVAALMYSVNDCLKPAMVQDILKNTTDPISDANLFAGKVGTGRVNAYKAVKTAQSIINSTLDLYIKDNKQDFGYPNSYPFYWGAFDKSPDIWVRNQPDGFINQKHQTPQYSATQPVYVYVRVWNKSCVSSGEQGNLKLYWSKASSSSSWPQDWTGVNTNGDVIGTQAIPNLAPGESTILQFQWNIPNPHQFNNWNSCLLARIESISSDPIQSYSLLENQVYYNNNVALHNVSIVDKLPNTSYSNPMFTSLVRGGRGTFMYIGNVQDTPENYDITFGLPIEEISPSIAQQGEIHVMTDSVGWGILYPALAENPDVRIVGERHFRILSDTVILHNLTFPANTRSQIYVGFNFLIENIANEDSIFLYRVLQRYSDSTEHSTGAENFVIRKFPRDMFYVNAGDDKTIHKGESVLLQAADIGEPAIYNWYDQSGNLISSEMEVNVSPNATTSYTLEVIATADGYKDYDGVTVNVKQFWIESIVPNPTEANTVVSYNIEGAASNANLKLADQTGTVLHSYTLSIDSSELEINVSSYAGGAYNIILEVDGNNVDAKTLIIQ